MLDKTINENWSLLQTSANESKLPADILDKKDWYSACVPGTVAQALQNSDNWSVDENLDFDSYDWWYKTSFECDLSRDNQNVTLCFDGLATLADVWLNNHLILSSDNMFIRYEVDVSSFLKTINELVICFRSIKHKLNEKRPRPKWKTKLVDQQQLRWIRTTLLGRIPGWSPPIPPVGPWRKITLSNTLKPTDIQIKTKVNSHSGVVDFHCLMKSTSTILNAFISIDGHDFQLIIRPEKIGQVITGNFEIQNINLWWPHTHGTPFLYQTELTIQTADNLYLFKLPKIGFKSIQLDQSEDNFNFTINGLNVFCRGACWTINDIVSLNGDVQELENHLTLMRDAGANMIRVGGTMVYEQDYFYELCDQLGIMVWQDFMFANMDYPFEDPCFINSVSIEIKQQIQRLNLHACLSVYCGNSEIEQQVAMLGFEEKDWKNNFFYNTLYELCTKTNPAIPYVTSSPTGGDLPFRSHQNLSHYYGVGAYLRPISELRSHDVKFTSETLGFANIPISKSRNEVFDGESIATHNPKWKKRTPRDIGTGWDFEDVRDHYLECFYGIDPVKLRSFDPEKYLQLSEIVTGEIMSQVYSEWRSNHSNCSGGLIWFMKDLWLGAGWGIIDSLGIPKACYYYLKRIWQPINIMLTDESLNGIDVHICNESEKDIQARLEIILLSHQDVVIGHNLTDIQLLQRSNVTFNFEKILGGFYDITYAYRFGPPKHKLVAARIWIKDTLISESYLFQDKAIPQIINDASLDVNVLSKTEKEIVLKLKSNRFLYGITIETAGYVANNNFFHLLPETEILVTLTKLDNYSGRVKCFIGAINLAEDVRVKI